MSERPSTMINIPEKYKENERNGLCRVCGKPKDQWSTSRRVFCGDDCYREYQKCFETWNGLKSKIIRERGPRCEMCGAEDKGLELDHIVALTNGGDMWEKSNLRLLCHGCHVKKTKVDMMKKRYVKEGQRLLGMGCSC